MMEGFWTRMAFRIWAVLILLFLFIPIFIIFLYAFNQSNIESWPISGLSTRWISSTWNDPDVRTALELSVKTALGATALAVVLGTCAALAIQRAAFFGRDAISFMFVLPLALPGIITGISLRAFFSFNSIELSIWTIIVGHTTFCIVVVYNNVIARMRRSSASIEEASMDLGADALQTFRHVTLPVLATALLAGGMLAFALSFDEIIVTNFTAGTDQTLPIWIFSNIKQANQRPIVNVVAVIVILLSTVPVYIAQRLAGTEAASRSAP